MTRESAPSTLNPLPPPSRGRLAALYLREIGRLVSYLSSSDRSLGGSEVESIAQQVFLDLRATWPSTGAHTSPQVHLFAVVHRVASSWPRAGTRTGDDALTEWAPAIWDRADVARLAVLQDALDRLPVVPRQVVLLRELCGFTQAETAEILGLPEKTVGQAREDALKALVPVVESGVGSGRARPGPLSPEDFVALGRVLERGDGQQSAARVQFAQALDREAGPGAPSTPAAVPPGSGTAAAGANGANLNGAVGGDGAPDTPVTRVVPTDGATGAGSSSQLTGPLLTPRSLLGRKQRPAPRSESPAAPRVSIPPGVARPQTEAGPPPPAPTRPAAASPKSPVPLPSARVPSAPIPPAPIPPNAPAPSVPESTSWHAPSPLDPGTPLAALAEESTPIFDAISAWFSSTGVNPWAALDDRAWREASARAAAPPQIDGSTTAGLPKRRPGENMVPSAAEASPGSRPVVGSDPERTTAGSVRSRLDGLQRGLQSARQERTRNPIEPIAAEAAAAVEASLFGPPTSPPPPIGNSFEAPRAGNALIGRPPLADAPPRPGTTPPATPQGPLQGRGLGAAARPAALNRRVPLELPRAQQSRAQSRAEQPPTSPATAGGEPAFAVFYRDHLPHLIALLMIEGAQPAVAAEVAQSVMSAAHREWARIDSPQEWARVRALSQWQTLRGPSPG